MDKKTGLILLLVAAIVIGIIAVKPYMKSTSANTGGGIDPNPDYAQAIADAQAQGQPVFLEFYGDT